MQFFSENFWKTLSGLLQLVMNSTEVQNPRRKLDDVFIRELVGLGHANKVGMI